MCKDSCDGEARLMAKPTRIRRTQGTRRTPRDPERFTALRSGLHEGEGAIAWVHLGRGGVGFPDDGGRRAQPAKDSTGERC